MVFVIGMLTVVMVLNCLILVLLVLIQLPKKDAGAGVAFGGAATDALFGAGSGNVLTKTTKYSAVLFFALAVVLSVMQSHQFHHTSSEFRQQLEQERQQAPMFPASSPQNTKAPEATPAPATTTGVNLFLPTVNPTNSPPAVP
jgi:preprotein translocase subunit SecG